MSPNIRFFGAKKKYSYPYERHSKRRLLYLQIGFKFEEETSEMLYLEHSFYGAETWTFEK
jgi:hypothetical protein